MSQSKSRKHRAREIALVLVGLWGVLAGRGGAEDWPTYMHDNRRSGVTGERLDPASLERAWTYVAPHSPQRAFAGPAPRDFYNAPLKAIKPRLDFDRVFHVAVAGDRVFFGSSAEDSVQCIDAAGGERVWRFFTEGPVRMAPTVEGERVYAGSDDGRVYCLRASDGTEIWSRHVAPTDYRVPYNGKMISVWPVRSGVLVEGGRIFCSAGFLPTEGTYTCAMNAEDGSTEGDGLWMRRSTEITVQGYMLAGPDRLYMTAGRSTPYIFDRMNGDVLGQVSGGGGTYALLTDENEIVYGPSREGALELSSEKDKGVIATFDGNHIIITSATSYMHDDVSLSALDRVLHRELEDRKRLLQTRRNALGEMIKRMKDTADEAKLEEMKEKNREIGRELLEIRARAPEAIRWSEPCAYPYSLILAGDVLFAGGDGAVGAFDSADGRELASFPVTGRAFGLAVAGGRLFVSTGDGAIHCFRDRSASVAAR